MEHIRRGGSQLLSSQVKGGACIDTKAVTLILVAQFPLSPVLLKFITYGSKPQSDSPGLQTQLDWPIQYGAVSSRVKLTWVPGNSEKAGLPCPLLLTFPPLLLLQWADCIGFLLTHQQPCLSSLDECPGATLRAFIFSRSSLQPIHEFAWDLLEPNHNKTPAYSQLCFACFSVVLVFFLFCFLLRLVCVVSVWLSKDICATACMSQNTCRG